MARGPLPHSAFSILHSPQRMKHGHRTSTPARSALLHSAFFILHFFACGCGGSAHLELAALDYRSIDPPAPRTARFDTGDCYWWQQGRQVWIAIERVSVPPLLGKAAAFQFQLSLELPELPAGRARDYLVERRELRARARIGPLELRFTSLAGIVALYREPGEQLRGSLRLVVSREANQLLGGWARGSNVLMLGTFTAVHDEARGRRIAAQTEGPGWERDPPASQPGAQPE